MRVLQVSAEIFPLLKTGGLADVAGALPFALEQNDCDVRLVLPGFLPMLNDLSQRQEIAQRVTPWGFALTVVLGRSAALKRWVYLIEAPSYYLRQGGPYDNDERQPYSDNLQRFAALGWVAAQLALGLDSQWQPQILHCHDWHAGLAPAYLAFAPQREVKSIFTVHNLAYQGVFSADQFSQLGLPAQSFAIEGLEFHGQISFMKAGLYYADQLTTVSPTYAKEIQTPELGCGLEGLLRSRSDNLKGILNGVDEAIWNPRGDLAIPYPFDALSLNGKVLCKAHLQQKMGLAVASQTPLFGIVSRLTEQKGLHLVLAAIDDLVARGAQLVVLGNGDTQLEQALREQVARYPKAIAAHLGYDEAIAHQIFAGTDVTLVPSRFEPCGLTQLYALKYGSLPLVRRVGGLADTVVDCTLEDLAEDKATGFVFNEFTEEAMSRALRRALTLYQQPAHWARVVQRAMASAVGWQHSAGQYAQVYKQRVW